MDRKHLSASCFFQFPLPSSHIPYVFFRISFHFFWLFGLFSSSASVAAPVPMGALPHTTGGFRPYVQSSAHTSAHTSVPPPSLAAIPAYRVARNTNLAPGRQVRPQRDGILTSVMHYQPQRQNINVRVWNLHCGWDGYLQVAL